jgi:hypothetical protein
VYTVVSCKHQLQASSIIPEIDSALFTNLSDEAPKVCATGCNTMPQIES